MDSSNYALVVLFTAIAMVLLLIWVVIVLPQRRARKNQELVIEDLKIGEEIVTIGGVIGKLTYLNRDEDLARIEVAKGIEVRIIPAAISHPLDYLKRKEAAERAASRAATKKK
jgi:preprotein translocase subunit YajC